MLMNKFCVLLQLFILCILCSCTNKIDITPIEQDCEYLKKILPEASIDFSYAVDEGLDVDSVISEIKKTYESFYVPYNIKNKIEVPDEKGIYKDAFSSSIAWVLKEKIPYKNTHNAVYSKNITKETTIRQYGFSSSIYFEKRNDDFFVINSNNVEIKIGMKYTGNIKNICKTLINNEILYEYIDFNEFSINESIINLDGTDYTIPVKYYSYNPPKESNIISYKPINNSLLITINSFITHTEKDNQTYEQTIDEICKDLHKYNTLIFDLRNNSGGSLSKLYPLIDALILGSNFSDKQEEYNYDDILTSGAVSLNTETIRYTQSLRNSISFYINNLDKRYIEHNILTNQDKTFIPKFNRRIIVLQNTATCSAAECFIALLQYFFGENVLLFGQKTAGMLDFGNELDYRLPDSNLVLHLSSTDLRNLTILKYNPRWLGDSEGFYPDYWFFSDNEDVTNFIINNTNLFFKSE